MQPQWCIVELLGHRQRAGWLSEEQIAGAGFLRLDIPQEGGLPLRTEYYGTAAVYAIHPSDETQVRAMNRPRQPLMLTGITGFLEPVEEFTEAVEMDEDDSGSDPWCEPEESEEGIRTPAHP